MFKKYIFFIVLLFFISLNLSYSDGDIKPTITKVDYSGNLSSETIINIRGTDLEKCSNLILDNKKLNILSKTNTLITFKILDYTNSNGKIELECSEKNISYYYSFPYIGNISLSDNDKTLTITGNNFSDKASVNISGGSFKSRVTQNSLILGEIPGSINSNELYIKANGLSSNILNLDIILPKIDFIYAKDGFLDKTEIQIFGKYLNYYKNTKVLVGDEEISKLKFDDKNGSITFLYNGKVGKKKVKVISNGFESNSLSIDFYGDELLIDNIGIKNLEIDENGKKISKDFIVLLGKNFSKYRDDINVYNNGKKINIYKINSNEILIDKSILVHGDNYFNIELNGYFSNVLKYENNFKIPYVSGFELGTIDGTKRNISIYLSNFNEKEDLIYFNNSSQKIIGCLFNMCRIQIPVSSLKGSFSAGTKNTKSDITKEFDITKENTPFIEYVSFNGEIRQGTKVEIVGSNFTDSNISIANLFDKDEKGKIDMEVTNNKITGRIPLSFKPSSNSSISITKFGQKADLSFKLDDITGTKIYGKVQLDEIKSKSEDMLLKKGTLVEINGKGFRYGDNILIGSNKINLDFNSYNSANFVIPENIEPGKYNLIVENKDGQKSNSKEIIVLDSNFKSEIILESSKIKNNLFYINESNKDSIFDLNISNKIEDLILKEISFKINDYDKNDFLGTFNLSIENKNIGKTIIDNEGIIKFFGKFDLLLSDKDIKLSLIKDSNYLKENNYEITLLDDLKVISKADNRLFENINYKDINGSKIEIYKKDLIKCVDSSKDNINCNSYFSKNKIQSGNISNEKESIKHSSDIENKEDKKINYNKNSEKITDSNDEINSKEKVKNNKKNDIYSRIDILVSSFIEKNNNKNIKDRFNTYKNFRTKISSIISRNKNNKNIKYIEYYFTQIDLEYKKVFKEYILSR